MKKLSTAKIEAIRNADIMDLNRKPRHKSKSEKIRERYKNYIEGPIPVKELVRRMVKPVSENNSETPFVPLI